MLKARVITALILVIALGLILFVLPAVAARATFMLIAGLAAWEWAGLMKQPMLVRQAFGVGMVAACWQLDSSLPALAPGLFGISTLFWLLVVPVWFRFKWELGASRTLGFLLGCLVILPTWAAMVLLHGISVWMLLAAMGLVWVADITAYFAGRAFGRHKLAPSISPGKTWEGVAGAMLGVGIYGACLLIFGDLDEKIPVPTVVLVFLLPLLTGVSVMGDLFESLLKRQAGIKDSSQLLPGHGGVLDRIDALTSTLPVVGFILILVRS